MSNHRSQPILIESDSESERGQHPSSQRPKQHVSQPWITATPENRSRHPQLPSTTSYRENYSTKGVEHNKRKARTEPSPRSQDTSRSSRTPLNPSDAARRHEKDARNVARPKFSSSIKRWPDQHREEGSTREQPIDLADDDDDRASQKATRPSASQMSQPNSRPSKAVTSERQRTTSITTESPNQRSSSGSEQRFYSPKASITGSASPSKTRVTSSTSSVGRHTSKPAADPAARAASSSKPGPRSVPIINKCQLCKDDKKPCDGQHPCSTCIEAGKRCSPQMIETDRLEDLVQDIHRNASKSTAAVDNANVSDTSPRSVRSANKTRSQTVRAFDEASSVPLKSNRTIADLLFDHLDDDDNDHGEASDDLEQVNTSRISDVPLEIDYFRKVVNEVKQQMEAAHEENVIASLRASAQRSRTQAITKSSAKSNPFDAISSRKSTTQVVALLSRGPKASAQWESVSAPYSFIKSEVLSLPKTKSIGRVGPSLLSQNSTIGKYHPYSLDDEAITNENDLYQKYKEVQERYRDFTSNSVAFSQQRACAEFVDMYRQHTDGMFKRLGITAKDVVGFFLSTDEQLKTYEAQSSARINMSLSIVRDTSCQTCHIDCQSDRKQRNLRDTENMLSLDAAACLKAALLASAFHGITKISLWHLVSEMYSIVSPVYTRGSEEKEAEEEVEQICLICGLHACSLHGAYVEPEGEEIRGVVFLNDRESSKNSRWAFATYSNPLKPEEHVCGVWCGGPDGSLEQYKGLDDNGRVDGYLNISDFDNSHMPHLADDTTCSKACFWSKQNRNNVAGEPLTDQDEQIFSANIRQCMQHQRGPCMMHDQLPHVDCADLFSLMLSRARKWPHPEPFVLLPQKKPKAKGKHRANGKIDLSNDQKIVERSAFFPCDHDGPCTADNEFCKCAQHKVSCEQSCRCSKSCERLFRGCNCGIGLNTCADNKCACWQAGRECDPVLCKGCGVETVLHQLYKYDAKMRIGRCKNSRIQLGLPARTIKAPSEVQGYGLFAGEDLKKGDFINEYRGEIISAPESDRRGAMYSLAGQEYLFRLNAMQEVDASNFGNKARFMNNSGKDSNINVVGQLMLCNGQHRIGLFAKRDIKAGEELLYNYDYPASVTSQFWERGERSAKSKATTEFVSAAARSRQAAGTGDKRKIKLTFKASPSTDASPVRAGRGNRKRGALQSSSSRAALREEVDDFDPMEVDEAAKEKNEQADLEDSDFAAADDESQESSGSEEPEEEVPDSDPEEQLLAVTPRRRK